MYVVAFTATTRSVRTGTRCELGEENVRKTCGKEGKIVYECCDVCSVECVNQEDTVKVTRAGRTST